LDSESSKNKEKTVKTLYMAMEKCVLVAQQHHGDWQVESHLDGLQALYLTTDPLRPEHVYCGTYRRGLWRSRDAGRTWQPIGDLPMVLRGASGIPYSDITALAVSATERAGEYGVVYVGTEPSAMFRSEDGGTSWQELASFRELPSSSTWSFPPKPASHHVHWITPDPRIASRVFVAVEAGALVHTLDGGATWEDRAPDGPYDTHTLVMHPQAPDRLYVAAGDGFLHPNRGYQESYDGGKTWHCPDEGLHHQYLMGVAIDAGNPETILVSAASTPQLAHHRSMSEATVYRKTQGQPWQEMTNGLPEAKGSMTAVITSSSEESGVFYLLSNRGCYHSTNAGLSWEPLLLPWGEHLHHQHPQAIAVGEV
jgi:photosystem II stability/assembly factor-like uncharacterized protein